MFSKKGSILVTRILVNILDLIVSIITLSQLDFMKTQLSQENSNVLMFLGIENTDWSIVGYLKTLFIWRILSCIVWIMYIISQKIYFYFQTRNNIRHVALHNSDSSDSTTLPYSDTTSLPISTIDLSDTPNNSDNNSNAINNSDHSIYRIEDESQASSNSIRQNTPNNSDKNSNSTPNSDQSIYRIQNDSPNLHNNSASANSSTNSFQARSTSTRMNYLHAIIQSHYDDYGNISNVGHPIFNSTVREGSDIANTVSSPGNVNSSVREGSAIATTVSSPGNLNSSVREGSEIATTVSSPGNVNSSVREGSEIATTVSSNGNVNSYVREESAIATTVSSPGNPNTNVNSDTMPAMSTHNRPIRIRWPNSRYPEDEYVLD